MTVAAPGPPVPSRRRKRTREGYVKTGVVVRNPKVLADLRRQNEAKGPLRKRGDPLPPRLAWRLAWNGMWRKK